MSKKHHQRLRARSRRAGTEERAPHMGRVAAIAVVALAIGAVGLGVAPHSSAGAAVVPPPYTGPAVTGPENTTLLYQTLAETAAAGKLASIGHPRDLVFGAKNTDLVPGSADEPAYAHSIGARAIKYVQFTWFPTQSNRWLGTTAAERADWALCKRGTTPFTDATDGDGSIHDADWTYADANERSYVDAVLEWTAQLKAMGYDGVFFDASGRALRGPAWKVVSTCTTDPVVPGARASDAFARLLSTVQAQGLQVAAINVGSPTTPDPFARPDPVQPSRTKTDLTSLDWILHENAARPTENYPGVVPAARVYGTPFDTLAARARDDARYGRSEVVEMAKARLPLDDPSRGRQEQYVWALAKLSGAPVALNASFDFCDVPAGTDDCNRTGLSRPLTDIRLGTPIDSAPYPVDCAGASCMWVRRFQQGLVVVSAYGTPRRVTTIPLGTAGCRRVSAFQGGAQAKGACVREVDVATGMPSYGRIFLYG
jgi:hypothetical protein